MASDGGGDPEPEQCGGHGHPAGAQGGSGNRAGPSRPGSDYRYLAGQAGVAGRRPMVGPVAAWCLVRVSYE